MPQRATPFFPNQYYHFYNRGNNRQVVFLERDSYLYFLHGIKKYLCPRMDILAYSLMPTHYHILGRIKPTSEVSETSEVSMEITSITVSLAMQKLGISYTKAINKRFNRVGALFQGQFQGKPIQHYHHLLSLCLYIHTNPVQGRIVAQPEDWEFSNYLEWMQLREGTLANREFIIENFGTPDEYKALMMEHIQTGFLPDDMSRYLQHYEDK